MEFLRILSRNCIDQRLRKCIIFNHILIKHKYILYRKLHHSKRIVNHFGSHQNRTVTQRNITLSFLKRQRSSSSNDNYTPGNGGKKLPQSDNATGNMDADDYAESSDDEYSTDANESPSYEQLAEGQSVKDLLEGAHSQRLNDDFNFEASAEDEVSRKRAYINPKDMTVFLFPGQGTQIVGMGKALLSYPNVGEMFAIASEILGYDLLSLCLEGPQEKLNQTIHCQPAVVITSLAAVEKLKEEEPKLVENCVAAAGFSVGEFAALVFSGALTFEQAIYLIKVRAEAMQSASDLVDSGMLSVIARESTDYKLACREAREYCMNEAGVADPVCSIANYMFPGARVIAGHSKALDFLQENSKKFLMRTAKRIPVSGAFHTDLMKPAQKSLAEALAEVDFDIPAISVHSNVDGKKYRHANHIRKQLVRQVVKPVKWEQTMHEIYQRRSNDNFPTTIEVGPGNQLGTILKRVNFKAAKMYKNIHV